MITAIISTAIEPCQSVANCCSFIGDSPVGRPRPRWLRAVKVPSKNWKVNGKISCRPERLRLRPPSTVSQKITFCPALNFRDGGWLWPSRPPPLASQTRSWRLGMLCQTQSTNMSAIPAMKPKPRKSWASLPHIAVAA
jgi:hypothetical protein